MSEDRRTFYCCRCQSTVSVEKEDAQDELARLGWSFETSYMLCPHCQYELQRFMNGEAIEEV